MRSFAVALFAGAAAATSIENWGQGPAPSPWAKKAVESWNTKPANNAWGPKSAPWSGKPAPGPWTAKPHQNAYAAKPPQDPWPAKPPQNAYAAKPPQYPWDTKPPQYSAYAAKPPQNAYAAKPPPYDPQAAKPHAYNPFQSSYGYRNPQLGQTHGYQHGSNQHQQPGPHSHYKLPAAPPSHTNSYSYSPHSHAHNPMEPWNTHKPEGWWSAHQQYSPPKIAYVPTKLLKPAYGICQFTDADGLNYVLKIGQMPGHPAAIAGSLDVATGLADTVLGFKLRMYGDIGANDDGDECGNGGKEFNPLAELIYGVPNPYSDPSRGTIASQTVVEDGEDAPAFTWIQPKFLQNIGGKNSIIGKSIMVTSTDTSDPPVKTTAGCCVIGDAAPPVNPNANNGYAHNHHHPAHPHGHGHGHYGSYGGKYGGYGPQRW